MNRTLFLFCTMHSNSFDMSTSFPMSPPGVPIGYVPYVTKGREGVNFTTFNAHRAVGHLKSSQIIARACGSHRTIRIVN